MNNRLSTPAWVRAVLPGLLLAAVACVHPWLEQTMGRHMGLQLPALFLIGWVAGACAGPCWERMLRPWNASGLAGMLLAACVGGFWMLPVALDAAVLHPLMGTAKVASLVTAGMLLQASWSTAGTILHAFFVLNWFWMTMAAGMLYQEAPQQLCSVYLANEQQEAGLAVMVWAAIGLGAWLWRVAVDACREEEVRDGASLSAAGVAHQR